MVLISGRNFCVNNKGSMCLLSLLAVLSCLNDNIWIFPLSSSSLSPLSHLSSRMTCTSRAGHQATCLQTMKMVKMMAQALDLETTVRIPLSYVIDLLIDFC